MKSPTAQTLNACRSRGWLPAVVERYNAFTKRKADAWGWCDILAVDAAGGRIVGIQTTTRGNAAARVAKIKSQCREPALAWLQAGGRLLVHGWSLRKVKRGGKAKRWHLTEIEITEGDL